KKYPEAIAEMEKALRDQETAAPILAMVGYAYGVAGKNREARDMLRRLEDLSKRSYVSPYDHAVLHTGLGATDDALRRLEQAMDERSPRVIWLNVEPAFDPLRGNPRFENM